MDYNEFAKNVCVMADNLIDMAAAGVDPRPLSSQPTDSSLETLSASDSNNASAIKQVQPTPLTGRPIPWGQQCKALDPDFIEGLLWVESQLGLKPEALVPCMKFESNLDPKARNPASSASGLIQFMDSTAKTLGTTIEAIRGMDAMTQLGWVYRYFKGFKDRGMDLASWDASDCYMAILWPAGIGKPMDYKVFVNDPMRSSDSYDVNKGLDTDKDGTVTKAEACSRVINLQRDGLIPENVLVV